jgi:hypothetical protein
MTQRMTITWLDKPEAHDYPADSRLPPASLL